MAEDRLKSANTRLKAGKIGVAIQQIKNSLYLVATFPPKPGSFKDHPYQQRIALGVYANPAGIKFAENEAKYIGGLLATKSFSWDGYLRKEESVKSVSDWIAEFEEDYFRQRGRTGKTLTTWGDYQYVFRALPEGELSRELLLKTVSQTDSNTRTRQKFCSVLGALAKFSGLDLRDELALLRGSYSPSKVNPRELPSDEEIVKWWGKIPNPAWRWAYGMMAAFGLRNHEVFFLDLEAWKDSNRIIVLDGKTGSRKVWALYPEWIEQFNLKEAILPNCSGKSHSDFGSRTHHTFSRYNIPFPPYALRHCWARRSIDFDLDTRLAAQQLGHSVKVHTETYNLWIDEKTHQRKYDQILARVDRPLPPG